MATDGKTDKKQPISIPESKVGAPNLALMQKE
jgi:hypothetical protein